MTIEINGTVTPGFEPVADAFAQNFRDGLEIGAALAVFRDGRPLIDIWAGHADSRTAKPWQRDTIQTIFSGTKGLTAMCMLLLIDRGLIDLDAPVATYWPEFGKPHVRIREIVSHRARLPGVATAEITPAQFTDCAYMEDVMAREPQSNDIRAALTYHGATIGWLCAGVVRRVTGKSLAQFFADEFARPLGLDIWIGLPQEQESRAARLETNETWKQGMLFREVPAIGYKDDVLFWSQWWNPSHLSPTTFAHWNTRPFRAGEIPAANAVGAARSIARLYGDLVKTGATLLSPATIALASTPLCDGWDGVLDGPRKNSVLFQLNPANPHLGPIANAFGHDGAGGSLHGAWPDQHVGFSYCMNLLRMDPEGERRTPRIMAALARCLGAT